MKMPHIRSILAAMIAAAVATSATLLAHASNFTISSSTSGSSARFIVTRDDATAAETVRYRTVSLSAYAGQHFTSGYGTLTFPAGQTAVTNFISERTPTTDAYRFQTGTQRSYRFELTDAGGFPITNAVRTIATGTSVSGSNAFGAKNLTINAGTITVTDGGYDQAYHSVTVRPEQRARGGVPAECRAVGDADQAADRWHRGGGRRRAGARDLPRRLVRRSLGGGGSFSGGGGG